MKKINPPLARRVTEIAPFRVMELLARARELEAQGRSIVHMEIGEPDFPTAKPICDAGIRVIETGNLFYTPALGLPELRAAIARYYRDRYQVEVPASQIGFAVGKSGSPISMCTIDRPCASSSRARASSSITWNGAISATRCASGRLLFTTET